MWKFDEDKNVWYAWPRTEHPKNPPPSHYDDPELADIDKPKPKPRRKRKSEGERTKRRLAERDGIECYLCLGDGFTLDELTIEHKIPLTRGGSRRGAFNLKLACKPCNTAKGDMTVVEYMMTEEYQRRLTSGR